MFYTSSDNVSKAKKQNLSEIAEDHNSCRKDSNAGTDKNSSPTSPSLMWESEADLC
jgi:hypothetical protein